jgi:hypothetical protein
MFSKRIVRSSPKFKFIRNNNYPVCDNCFNFRNFIPIEGTTSEFEYSKIGVCMKFGERNMITGKITYDSAIDCRNDVSKCTNVARYFTPLNPLHPWFIEN